jgi:hypothetical protein
MPLGRKWLWRDRHGVHDRRGENGGPMLPERPDISARPFTQC